MSNRGLRYGLMLVFVLVLGACAGAPSDAPDEQAAAPDTAADDTMQQEAEADTEASAADDEAQDDDSTEAEAAPESEPESDEARAEPVYETVEVADGLYSFGNGEVYSAFLATDEGVIVMDSVNPDHAALMLEAIREVTDQPIEYLIYSHNHWDHIGGGQVFKDEGATILAHSAIDDWLVSHSVPNPMVLNPDETWEGERHDVEIGGETVELHHFGPSHGEGMTVFRFPEQDTLFTVDLVVPKRVGFAYMPDFTPKDWIATLEAMEALDYETVMFAHNAASGPRSSVVEQREFIQDLRAEIMSRMQAGENPFVIVDTIELPEYEDWAGYDEWLTMNAWRIMLEMFMGH